MTIPLDEIMIGGTHLCKHGHMAVICRECPAERQGAEAARSRIVALLKDEDTADEVCVVLKEAVGTNERYKQIVKWTARALAEMIANAKE